MRRIILSSVACLGQKYLFISHNRNNFRKKVTDHSKCVCFSLQILSKPFPILRRKKSARYCHKCTYTFMQSNRYSYQNLMKLNFLNTLSKKSFKRQMSSKSVRWEPRCSTRTNGRADMTKLKVAFRNFVIAPKKKYYRYTTNDRKCEWRLIQDGIVYSDWPLTSQLAMTAYSHSALRSKHLYQIEISSWKVIVIFDGSGYFKTVCMEKLQY